MIPALFPLPCIAGNKILLWVKIEIEQGIFIEEFGRHDVQAVDAEIVEDEAHGAKIH